VLFCSGAGNCHFNTGHGGIGWGHYSALDDSALLYLRFNAEKARETVSQTGTKPGLMGALFGVLGTGKAKPPSARKPRANNPRRSIPSDDNYDEAY
jgi:hypothetical protein